MIVKFSRAQRRHDRARMYKRARRLQEMWWHNWWHTEEEIHRATCRLTDNMKICSCYSCRNQRRNGWLKNNEHLTMQERKANDAFEYEKEENEL